MKKTIINKWALAALATALTACNADELTRTDEAKLDPNTPVGITATLGAYGNSASRTLASRSGEPTADELAAVAAPGEITNSSTIKPEYTVTGSAYFYGYDTDLNNDWDNTMGNDNMRGFSLSGTIGNLKLMYDAETERGTLYIKDFKRGAEVSKTAFMRVQGPYDPDDTNGNRVMDDILAAADRTVTDGAPGYYFKLNHLCAKVSVKLTDAAGNAITTAQMQDGKHLCLKHLQNGIEQSEGTSETGRVTTAADITYSISPDQYNNYTEQVLAAISEQDPDATDDYKERYKGYYNALINASGYTGTSTDDKNHTDGPTKYTDADKFTVSLIAGTGKPAGNYYMPLSSVKLTGLSAGDTRATDTTKGGDGKWTYTRPGEHIFVTITVDQNQVMNATASIGDWNDATATAEAVKPGTDASQTYPSIEQNGTGAAGSMWQTATDGTTGSLKLYWEK